jgi:hypothetical protein
VENDEKRKRTAQSCSGSGKMERKDWPSKMANQENPCEMAVKLFLQSDPHILIAINSDQDHARPTNFILQNKKHNSQ